MERTVARFPVALLVVAGLLLLCWWLFGGEVAPPAVPTESEIEEPIELPVDPHKDDALPAVEREVLAAPVDYGERPADADLSHDHSFELTVKVVGLFGLPVKDARVFLAPDRCGFSMWPKLSDDAGVVQVAWRGRQRVMDVQVAVMAWGVMQPMRRIAVEADVDGRVAFVARGRRQRAAALLDLAESDQLAQRRDVSKVRRARSRSRRSKQARQRMDELDFTCGRTMVMFRFHRCHECHDSSRLAVYRTIARAGLMGSGPHPHAGFQDLRVTRLQPKEIEARREEVADQLRTELLGADASSTKRRARVMGRVLGADGKGAAGVPVALLGEGGVVLRTTKTDHAGRYRMDHMPGGNLQMHAGTTSTGIVDQLIRVAPTGRTRWDCRLEMSRSVRGIALDEHGNGLQAWRIELVRDAAGWAAMVAADKRGEFAAFGVPGPVQCLLWPKDETSSFPVLHGGEALVDASQLLMRLDSQRPIRGRLRAHAAVPDGARKSIVDARAIQLETGRVAQMSSFGFENAFSAEPLSPGAYRVELGVPGCGWVARDENVDGRGLWDLGRMSIPEPGSVRLVRLDGAESVLRKVHAFYRRTSAVDVLQDYKQSGREFMDGVVRLPAGNYVLVWHGGPVTETRVRAREFEVVSGLETQLVIWPEAASVEAGLLEAGPAKSR